jgi:hypothetical protein
VIINKIDMDVKSPILFYKNISHLNQYFYYAQFRIFLDALRISLVILDIYI